MVTERRVSVAADLGGSRMGASLQQPRLLERRGIDDRHAVGVRVPRALRALLLRDRRRALGEPPEREDRKSTRLNSRHPVMSYAVFCLKKTTPLTPWLSDLAL